MRYCLTVFGKVRVISHPPQSLAMLTYRHETRREFRVTASLAAIWFTLFVVLVPIFHRHEGEMGFGSPFASAHVLTASDAAAGGSSAAAAQQTPVFHKTHGLNPQNQDDCPLCQWFGLGFTPPCVFTHQTKSAALAQLLFDVRRAELCRRPLPRRGLRAPPCRQLTPT